MPTYVVTICCAHVQMLASAPGQGDSRCSRQPTPGSASSGPGELQLGAGMWQLAGAAQIVGLARSTSRPARWISASRYMLRCVHHIKQYPPCRNIYCTDHARACVFMCVYMYMHVCVCIAVSIHITLHQFDPSLLSLTCRSAG